MWLYNQYQNKETAMACSIYSLLQIMLYRYWIKVEQSFFIKAAIFFDSIWKFDMKKWATFSIIDKSFVWYLNYKLGLKFKLESTTIEELESSDKKTYQLWIKNYSNYKYKKAKKWDRYTKESMDYLASFDWESGHAANYDWSAGWYFIDTNASKNVKMSLSVLKYWKKLDLFWWALRTISPDDKITEEVCKLCIKLFQAEKRWTLETYINSHKNNPYIAKARELYMYGR